MLHARTVAIEDRIHRLTTAEYERMVDSGALEGLHVELLDGLIVDQPDMSPQGEVHHAAIHRLMMLCAPRIDLLRVQAPLAVGDGWVPEPDVALAPLPAPGTGHPSTALLVAEVAVSSLTLDRTKARAYSRAGVPRYWIVDLPGGRVIEHTRPGPDGYASIVERTASDVLETGVDGIPATSAGALLGPPA